MSELLTPGGMDDGWIRLWTRKRRRSQLEQNLLPMTDKLHAVLCARWKERDTEALYVFHKNRRMLSRDSDFIRHMMGRLCDRAGVKPFGFHAIRHHVASVIEDSGKATMKEIQLFLRHKRQATTENYLHEMDSRLTRVIDILDESRETKNETNFKESTD
jgi:integrase